MNNQPNKKSSVARRFIIYIVLFSSFITLIITAIQLNRDYKNDLSRIHIELEQIENVHLGSLTAALWASNSKLLQTNIEGILEIRDIQYVEIRDSEKVWAKTGEVKGKDNIERSYAMSYLHRNKNINIGTLFINVSLDGVYQRLIYKVWDILISNAIKTSLVALFISFLFYHLVARHLSTISKYLESHDVFSSTELISLDRSNKNNDEFDAVVESINAMHERLDEQVYEIESQKQHLSQTLNSIGDAVITTDAKGVITRLNPVAEQLTGWFNIDAKGKMLNCVFNIVNESTRIAIENPIEKILATGETVYLSNHTTLISKNGNEYQIFDSAAPIRDRNEIVGMVLVFSDVTEQYKIRQELKDSYSKLEKLASRLPGMVYQFKLDSDGTMSFPYISDAINKLYNISAEEVYEDVDKIFSRVHPDDLEKLNSSMHESARSFIPWKLEYRIFDENGNVRWLYCNSLPEKIDDGGVLWHGFVTDITEKNETEENLRRTLKMDALGKLTGGIAHDYNNMLGVILGYSELLDDSLIENPKLKKYVEEIKHAGARGAKLTKKMLAFSRNQSNEPEKTNINKLLHDAQHMLEKTLTARIQLELTLENELWPVYLDESELEDALLNISINAMHAIESTGQLRIETVNKKIDFVEAEGLSIDAGDYVQLWISDNGCGMDSSTREKVFDPFYSTKGENGTGLGLSQVYGFMMRCNGAIKVESKLNHGSEFILYFPRYFGETVSSEQQDVEVKKALNGKETILVVDDEPALLNVTCEVLRQNGYKILSAEHALKALDILEKEQVDLVLSDIIMPDMDGYSLANIVQEKHPDIKIQLASGYSGDYRNENEDNELSKNMLHKPYSSKQLLNRINILLG